MNVVSGQWDEARTSCQRALSLRLSLLAVSLEHLLHVVGQLPCLARMGARLGVALHEGEVIAQKAAEGP